MRKKIKFIPLEALGGLIQDGRPTVDLYSTRDGIYLARAGYLLGTSGHQRLSNEARGGTLISY